jgi:hypothetical protein
MGRPPLEYTEEVGDAICSAISEGRSLKTICALEEMPSTMTVFKWLRTLPNFATQYADAREAQADAFVDEMQAIADDKSLDPNDRRIRIDTRKWIAAKMRPKKYGDRTDVSVSGTLTLETLVTESIKPKEPE